MATSNAVSTSNFINDDLFLCRAFAQAISSDQLIHKFEQKSIEIPFDLPSNEDLAMKETKISQWNVGDFCLCPFTEDNLLYKATIKEISSFNCTVLFDEYGNEEIHPLTDLQVRTEEEPQDEEEEEEETNPMIEPSPPLIPPFPSINSTNNEDPLSATLMSWYLAGYHTGFYQAMKEKNS